ncbi:hypothetical protein PUN28_004348 [Cardiocondyla obscurior]|uniref:Uncharacterized protein n=1 Tax=Cardiocondyla obscurior TaxID=286306 RepID=A0AAW2GFE3_9HYME
MCRLLPPFLSPPALFARIIFLNNRARARYYQQNRDEQTTAELAGARWDRITARERENEREREREKERSRKEGMRGGQKCLHVGVSPTDGASRAREARCSVKVRPDLLHTAHWYRVVSDDISRLT